MYLIKTNRLGLRNWKESDITPMTALNQDEEVMRFFPSTVDYNATSEFVKRMQKHQEDYGFCYFAVDILATGEFIGFIGLCHQTYESPYTPHVDIGWRLARSSWGNGYATEGAKACLDFAFSVMKLDRIYSVATEMNTPSIHVMQKIGMQKIDTFDHPKLLNDDRLRRCVLYNKTE